MGGSETEANLALFSQNELFAGLDPSERRALAEVAERHSYRCGQTVVRQGDRDNSLFVLERGNMDVSIRLEGQQGTSVAGRPSDGDVFGEMSLLTGAPRSATVTAATDCVTVRIAKRDIEPLIHGRPALANHLGKVLADRQARNYALMMGAFGPVSAAWDPDPVDRFGTRIKAFFGMPVSMMGKLRSGIGGAGIGGPIGDTLGDFSGRTGESGWPVGDSYEPTPLSERDRHIAYTTSVVVLAAKLAKADGSVSANEIAAFKRQFNIAEDETAWVGQLFNEAKTEAGDFEPHARQMASLFADSPAVLEEFLLMLLRIAEADGPPTADEWEFLRAVAEILGIRAKTFEHLCRLTGGVTQDYGMEKWSDPYDVLGIDRNIGDDALKKQYRARVFENHPDRLVAQGLPPECVDQATVRLAAINNAYNDIRVRRGL